MITLKSYRPGTRDWLQQAVAISWFTDARLPDSEPLPDNSNDRRGHWGDTFVAGNDSIGSLLWTLYREKMTTAIVNRGRDIATEALQWLLDTPYVVAVQVEAERLDTFTLALQATLTLPNGTQEVIEETFNAV